MVSLSSAELLALFCAIDGFLVGVFVMSWLSVKAENAAYSDEE